LNRLQFLAEMKKSLINTTKEITFPFLDEKLEHLDSLADQIVGVIWLPLERLKPSSFSGVQEHFINSRSVLLYSDGKNLKAYGKICSSCNSLAQWIAFDEKLTCFICERSYDVVLETGDLCCKRYSTKEKAGVWFIEMEK